MSLLDTAQDIAQQGRDKHQALLAAQREESERKTHLLAVVQGRVLKLIADELEGKHQFSSEPYSDSRPPNIVVAALKHRGSCCGFFLVYGQEYTFRGSDESPEETLWHVIVSFQKTTKYDSTSFASASVNSTYSIDKDMADFGTRLAEHLARYF